MNIDEIKDDSLAYEVHYKELPIKSYITLHIDSLKSIETTYDVQKNAVYIVSGEMKEDNSYLQIRKGDKVEYRTYKPTFTKALRRALTYNKLIDEDLLHLLVYAAIDIKIIKTSSKLTKIEIINIHDGESILSPQDYVKRHRFKETNI